MWRFHDVLRYLRLQCPAKNAILNKNRINMAEKFEKDVPTKSWAHWIEIPVTDFDRAQAFYCTIFETQLHVMDLGMLKMGVFPHAEVGAALCKGEWYVPGPTGPVVYLNANPDLQVVQDRIEAAGGKVLMPKKMISPAHGYMALFLDTEGNRLALHSDA
jgi:predicted enzyme related to lactoylglutathione lyase